MNVRTMLTAVIAASALAVPTPALAVPSTGGQLSAAATGASAVASTGAAVPTKKKKPAAVVGATYRTLPNRKVLLTITSNAKKVQVKYRTAKNRKRSTTKKIKAGKANVTLAAGSKTIVVRAKATSKLSASRWTPATPPVVTPTTPPVITPTTPPVVTPTTPPVVTPTTPPVVTPPADSTAPGKVSALTLSAKTTTSLSLTWTNPTDPDFAVVIVRRAQGLVPPATPQAGVAVGTASARATSVTDAGLAPDTSFSYALFTRDTTGNTSTAATLTAATTATPTPLALETAFISTDADGNPGNGYSSNAHISGDGRWIVFESEASNLVAGDTNNRSDIFLHDTLTSTTVRISLAPGGGQANEYSAMPAISGDGRWIAYLSQASNLVAGDTNLLTDVFLWDRVTNTTTRILAAPGSGQSPDALAVSGDGAWVLFSSQESYVPEDTNGVKDVYLLHLADDTLTRVSVSSTGTQGNDNSWGASFSLDGRWIVFDSRATNLVPDGATATQSVYLHDRDSATTTRLSDPVRGAVEAQISSDGSWITYRSGTPDFLDGIYRENRLTGTRQLLAVSDLGNSWPTISADGRYVAFAQTWQDEDGLLEVWRTDAATGITDLLTPTSAGPDRRNYDVSSPIDISDDGQATTFMGSGGYLLPGANMWTQVILVKTIEP